MSDEKDDKWEMPKPVFRSTSGSAPKSLEDTISHSFIPNAETVEIAEDDDILGIMDAADGHEPYQFSENFGHEAILESETEAGTTPLPGTVKSEPFPDPDQAPAIKVTAKEQAEKLPEINGRRADF